MIQILTPTISQPIVFHLNAQPPGEWPTDRVEVVQQLTAATASDCGAL